MWWRSLLLGVVSLALSYGEVRGDELMDVKEGASEEPFEFAANVEFTYERSRNFDLDSGQPDDLVFLEADAALGVLFAPIEHLSIYLQPNLTREIFLRDQAGTEESITEFGFEEAYLTVVDRRLGLSLQVGRSAFVDARGWLFDEELDALRATYHSQAAFLDLSVSQEGLVDVDLLNADDIDPVTNYIAYGGFAPWNDITIGAYGIYRDHRQGPETRPLFIGAFANGVLHNHLTYWIDAAHVRGRDRGAQIRGYGIDLLGSYAFDGDYEPRVTLGYAFGSGDREPLAGKDGNFRQTGLRGDEGNEVELGGQAALKYLGEAFRPELSNLSVFTAGVGGSPCEGCSIDLLYHFYLQDEASSDIRRSGLEVEPTGRAPQLGQEIDLVAGFEALEGLDLRGFLGYFRPGKAFPTGADDAFLMRVEVEFDF